MTALRLVTLATSLMLATGAAAAGTPQVYDLDAGPDGTKILPGTSADSVNLQISLGTVLTSGVLTPCVDGDGDELCAAEVIVTLDGPGIITGFSQGTGVVFEPDPVVPTAELRLNLLQSLNPPTPGAQGLGTVYIDNTAQTANDVTRVTVSGSAVDASGTLRTISTPTPLAVPEPSSTVLLVSGVIGLGALFRWRQGGGDRSG